MIVHAVKQNRPFPEVVAPIIRGHVAGRAVAPVIGIVADQGPGMAHCGNPCAYHPLP